MHFQNLLDSNLIAFCFAVYLSLQIFDGFAKIGVCVAGDADEMRPVNEVSPIADFFIEYFYQLHVTILQSFLAVPRNFYLFVGFFSSNPTMAELFNSFDLLRFVSF